MQTVELLPSEQTAELTYEFPEVLPTYPGCEIAYRGFSEDKKDVLFTSASTPIKLIDDVERNVRRKLVFTADRSLVGTTKIFYIEAYTPKLKNKHTFRHQMAVKFVGKKAPLITSLKPAAFRSKITELEKKDNGDRVFLISKF